MLNILVFGQSFLGKIGGVQQSYAWLYDYLCGRGHKITHVTHLPVGERGLHYPFHPAVKIRSVNLLFGAGAGKKVRSIAAEIDPDVVLVINSSKTALQFCGPLYDTPYPVILSERGSPEYCITELWKSRRLHELAAARADFVHMLMPSYPLSLPPHLRDRARVISSLTQPAKIFASPAAAGRQGEYVILYTGRFSPEKRLPLLVRAFSGISGRHPGWRLRLVGDGPERGNIEKAIEAAGVSGKVDLPGYADTPEALCAHYASSHIFCLPSSYEGCPLALREAMAHALPVVGFSSCPGTNEIIESNRNGLLAAEDTWQSLGGCIEKLVADAALRENMGNAGRDDVKRYSPEKTHSAWESLLYEAAAWKGRKNSLRARRCLRNPFRFMLDLWQPLPCEQKNMPDTFATSPLAWLREIRGNFIDFALLNFFCEQGLVPDAPAPEIMNYGSKTVHALKQAGRGRFPGAATARNAAALAMRHGILLKKIFI